MKIFAITATALFATVAYAAPALVEARNSDVEVTFFAAPVSFSQIFVADDTLQTIWNKLSVSQIYVPGGFTCTFYGSNNSVTTVEGPSTGDVGPPQTQVSGKCHPT